MHRLPYPPNKGDKIRSYHLLRHLAGDYRVYLGAFVDDPADMEHVAALSQWCADVYAEPVTPARSRLRMLTGLFRGEPLSIASYRSRRMRHWVRRVVAETGASRLVAFSAAMAQYADETTPADHRVLDMVDVDSDKWRQYGERHRGPIGWIYRREARRLLDWERRAAARLDATTFVSAAETDLFRRLAPESTERIHAVSNGVDCAYFSPDIRCDDPYPAQTCPIVFTGAMDYWPNVDAVTWFADEVLPRVRRNRPAAVLYIVGARPTPAVRELADRPGVEVIGATPDMRPWLAHARLVVAPLRVARGIQNKVLEGFAMARPVLATPMALEGLELGDDYPLCAEQPTELARLAGEVLANGDGDGLGPRMRAWVVARYDWGRRLAPFDRLLADDLGDPADAGRAVARS